MSFYYAIFCNYCAKCCVPKCCKYSCRQMFLYGLRKKTQLGSKLFAGCFPVKLQNFQKGGGGDFPHPWFAIVTRASHYSQVVGIFKVWFRPSPLYNNRISPGPEHEHFRKQSRQQRYFHWLQLVFHEHATLFHCPGSYQSYCTTPDLSSFLFFVVGTRENSQQVRIDSFSEHAKILPSKQ